MKNQYFGDRIDFVNYALLRLITNTSAVKLGICWMLTPPDNSNEGKKITYLKKPDEWRYLDPELFDLLKHNVLIKRQRHIHALKKLSPFAQTLQVEEFLHADKTQRRAYFKQASTKFRNCELIFLDPDNGLEVKSVLYGRKHSNKYLYWHEVMEFWRNGHSLFIAQHFPRENREQFVDKQVTKVLRHIPSCHITAFYTADIVFFLLAQTAHTTLFNDAVCRTKNIWPEDKLKISVNL